MFKLVVFLFIPLLVVYLTFIAPFWLKWVLIGVNCIIPDTLPYIDEVLQALAIFNSRPDVKAVKFGRSVKKIKRKMDAL